MFYDVFVSLKHFAAKVDSEIVAGCCGVCISPTSGQVTCITILDFKYPFCY